MKKYFLVMFLLISIILCAQSEETNNSGLNIELSPGDQIRIKYHNINNNGERVVESEAYRIQQDGKINHTLLGKVKLAGKKANAAESFLQNQFSKYIRNPNVSLSLIETQLNKVLLYGAVSRPGVYPVSATTRVADFIIQHGGTSEEADLSHITISRKGGESKNFNMKNFLYTDQPSNNIKLKAGDKVIVPEKSEGGRLGYSEDYILEEGNVLEIQVSEAGEQAASSQEMDKYIINEQGNIRHPLLGEVQLAGKSIRKARELLKDRAQNYLGSPVVELNLIQKQENTVFLFGEVPNPGIYPIHQNVRLAEFIAQRGGVTRSADIDEIILTRKSGNKIVFDFEDFLYNREDRNNVTLVNGDRIIVQSKNRGILYSISQALRDYRYIISFITSLGTLYLLSLRIR